MVSSAFFSYYCAISIGQTAQPRDSPGYSCHVGFSEVLARGVNLPPSASALCLPHYWEPTTGALNIIVSQPDLRVSANMRLSVLSRTTTPLKGSVQYAPACDFTAGQGVRKFPINGTAPTPTPIRVMEPSRPMSNSSMVQSLLSAGCFWIELQFLQRRYSYRRLYMGSSRIELLLCPSHQLSPGFF